MEKIVVVPTEIEARFFAEPPVICGVGMAQCAAVVARLIVDKKPSLVVLAGIAGTYSSELQVGDTVVVASETVADLKPARFQKTYTGAVLPEGFRAARSNTVNAAGGAVATDADIENMEGAAFFAVCDALGVPFVEIRTISNVVGEPVTPENLELAARNLAVSTEFVI